MQSDITHSGKLKNHLIMCMIVVYTVYIKQCVLSPLMVFNV